MATDNSTALEPSLKGWTPEEQALIDANAMDGDVFADRLFEQLEAAPAFLSHEQVYELEDEIRGDQIRRAALALSSLTGADMLKKIESDRDFAVLASGISDEMPALQEKYRGLADILKGLQGRVLIALASREDMQQVIEEGKSVVS